MDFNKFTRRQMVRESLMMLALKATTLNCCRFQNTPFTIDGTRTAFALWAPALMKCSSVTQGIKKLLNLYFTPIRWQFDLAHATISRFNSSITSSSDAPKAPHAFCRPPRWARSP